MSKGKLSLAVSGLVLLGAIACQKQAEPPPPPVERADVKPPAPAVMMAKADLMGQGITGTATFTEENGAVKIVVDVMGAKAGQHGLHLHMNADCSAADFTSAGDHFNPAGAKHGGPDTPEHHAGDLGNITVGDDGKGHMEMSSTMLTVAGGANSVVGRAIVLHESTDDMATDPSGNSGARIACGAVMMAEAAPAAAAAPAEAAAAPAEGAAAPTESAPAK